VSKRFEGQIHWGNTGMAVAQWRLLAAASRRTRQTRRSTRARIRSCRTSRATTGPRQAPRILAGIERECRPPQQAKPALQVVQARAASADREAVLPAQSQNLHATPHHDGLRWPVMHCPWQHVHTNCQNNSRIARDTVGPKQTR